VIPTRPRLGGQRLTEVAGRHVAQVLEVLRQQVLVLVEPELRLEGLQRLRAERALVVRDRGEGRVPRHQARQHEVQGEGHPEGQQEEARAAQHEPHAVLPSPIRSSS